MPDKTVFGHDAYIDFHTHRMRHEGKVEVMEIVSVHLGENKHHGWYTLGSHPWWTHELLSTVQVAELEARLTQDVRCLALGECGLDKLKGPPMQVQCAILEQVLDVADRNGKSVVIHCVRAYDELLAMKKGFGRVKNWAIHGYARHDVLAMQLVDKGFYLSVSPEERSHAGLLRAATNMPLERLLLETDSDPAQDIVAVYALAAALRGMEVAALKAAIADNCTRFF